MKALFVCFGNICRSPMAEVIFKDLADKEHLNVAVDSAGTGVRRGGKPVHHGTQKILDEMSLSYKGIVSRGIEKDDFETYDYIFAMDSQNYRDLMRLCPKELQHKIYMFLDPVEEVTHKDIPDPWYTGDFVETQNLVTLASKAWIKKIKSDFNHH